MTLDDLCANSHATAVEKGWWEDRNRNIYEQLFLMHTELTEAGEELRNNHLMDEVYYESTTVGEKPCGFVSEIADLLIRVGDTMERYGLADLLNRVMHEKMEYNKKRPYRHGNKAC